MLLDILLVCRDFYFAGIAAFFGGNTLHFDNIAHLQQFTKKLDVDRRRCIKRITLDKEWHAQWHGTKAGFQWTCEPSEDAGLLRVPLERLPFLQSVTIHCKPEIYRCRPGSAWAINKIREELEDVRRACGSKADLVEIDVVDVAEDGY